MLEALTSILETTTRRLAGAEAVDHRLGRLWSLVEANLAHDWTATELARSACMSPEHLRRLCHRHYQRSPAGHLTHLRMRRASTLLRASPAKLEEIAFQVGYGSMYAFSVAFRRWSGFPPGRFRRQGT